MAKLKDLTGQKFGRLTVISYYGVIKNHYYWNCICDCGKKCIVASTNLKSKRLESCGCLNKESVSIRKTKHKKSNTKLYKIWHNMKLRCYNVKNLNYKNYGGRNITICNEWQKFENFYNWSITNGYNDNLSIDRINVNGNYEPNNCRWITIKEQQNNRRNNHLLTFNGKTQTVAQWSKELNISNLRMRLKRGWSIERALTTPTRGKQNV